METLEAACGTSVADLSTQDLLDGLLGSDSQHPIDVGPGDLCVVESVCGGNKIVIAAFDYSKNHGSIGRLEAEQIIATLRRVRISGAPLVLLMNTSGIRVTDSTAGIASLRKLLREAEDARLQGSRMLAMIVKNTFGGASMLAAMCEKRIVHNRCLYAMSGPKLITQSVGVGHFDAGNQEAVRALLGGTARASVSRDFLYVAPTPLAYRTAMIDWLASAAPGPVGLEELVETGETMALRLDHFIPAVASIERSAALLDAEAIEIVDRVHPSGCNFLQVENLIIVCDRAISETRILALRAVDGCGMRDALALARELLASVCRGESHTRCLLLVNAESHAATPTDERAVLSEGLAHLALVIRWLHHHGQRIDVVVTGLGGGGIQGALGSAASSVGMSPGARLRVLPKSAMQALQKTEDIESGSVAMAIEVGAVDYLFNLAKSPQQGENHVG
jgi:hypothetical protein